MRTPVHLKLCVTLLVAGAIVLVCPPAQAAQDDDLARCQTVTDRSPDDIIIPLGGSPLAPNGVTIVPGETLCLSTAVSLDGIVHVWLASTDGAWGASLGLRLEARPGAAKLFVLRRRYLIGFLASTVDASSQRRPTGATFVRPETTEIDLAVPESKHLLLFGFGVPRVPYVPKKKEPPSPALRRGQFDFPIFGLAREISVGVFDRMLEASGFSALPRELVGGGFGTEFVFDRWRFDFPLSGAAGSAKQEAGGGEVRATMIEAGLHAGYDLLRWQGLALFGLAGIEGANFSMDARGPGWNLLGTRSASLGNPQTVTASAAIASVTGGLEEVLPIAPVDGGAWALTVSLRAGYARQFSLDAWHGAGPCNAQVEVQGLSLVDLSGGWVSIGVGFGGYTHESLFR